MGALKLDPAIRNSPLASSQGNYQCDQNQAGEKLESGRKNGNRTEKFLWRINSCNFWVAGPEKPIAVRV